MTKKVNFPFFWEKDLYKTFPPVDEFRILSERDYVQRMYGKFIQILPTVEGKNNLGSAKLTSQEPEVRGPILFNFR